MASLKQKDVNGICDIALFMARADIPENLKRDDCLAQTSSAVTFLRYLAKEIKESKTSLENTAEKSLKILLDNASSKQEDTDAYNYYDVPMGRYISTVHKWIEMNDEQQKEEENTLEKKGFPTYII